MEANRQILDSTEGVSAQVPTVSRTNSPPPSELMGRYDLADNWCYTQVKITKFNYMWTINNFSFCREEMGEVIKSSCFSAASNNNLRWCLRINPKGLDEESKDYLSLYLLLVHCGSKTEVKAKFKFSILNAKREETKAMESQRAYRFVQGKDWGFKKFIRRDFLMDESNGLLPDDKLTIFCEVSVVGEMVNKSGQANVQAVKVPECHLHDDLGSLLERQQLTDVVLCVYAPVNKTSNSHHPLNQSNINISNNVGSEHDQICARLANTLQSNNGSPGHLVNNSNGSSNNNPYSSSYSFRQHFQAISGRVSSGLMNGPQNNISMDCSSFHNNGFQHNLLQSSYNSIHFSPAFNAMEYQMNRQGMGHNLNICSSSSSGLIQDNFNPALSSLVNKMSASTKPGCTSHCIGTSVNMLDSVTNNNNTCLGGPASPSTSCQSLSYEGRVSHMRNMNGAATPNECKVNISSQKSSSTHQPEEPDDSSSNNSSDEVTNSTASKSGISSSAVNSESRPCTNQKACSSILHEMASKYEEVANCPIPASTTNSTSNSVGNGNSNGVGNVGNGSSTTPTTNQPSTSTATSNMMLMREFEAHKAILAARSPVFSAMFEHGMEETRQNRVEITDLDSETVAEVLRYIYTGQVANLDQHALNLLVAADKYQLDRLKSMCEESLVESLTVENSCDVLSYADIYNAEQLRANAMEFVLTHALEICDTVAFYSMASKRPHLLAESFHGLASQQAPPLGPARKRIRPA